jgi:hypothetical protein
MNREADALVLLENQDTVPLVGEKPGRLASTRTRSDHGNVVFSRLHCEPVSVMQLVEINLRIRP